MTSMTENRKPAEVFFFSGHWQTLVGGGVGIKKKKLESLFKPSYPTTTGSAT